MTPSRCVVPDASRQALACRRLPDAVADGPGNMAADEALLATAADEGRASLRFYRWSEPTLSLGYFQPSAPALAAQPGLAWVRRPSGGAALVHYHEWTYALALPPGRDWQPPGVSWICRFHHIIRQALEQYGVLPHLCQHEHKHGEVLCFLHHTPGDLILGGSKVAGSAQRKVRGAVLQHGGILLTASPHTPQLPGILDLGGPVTLMNDLPDAVCEAFTAATGWRLEPDTLSAREEAVRAELLADRYRSDAWNRRR